MEQLLSLNKHEELNSLLSGDKNSTSGIKDIEVQHLAWLAAHIPKGGDIVEIGSHRGKSICIMGTACLETGNTTARLFAIDLWTKGFGKTFAHYSSQETWNIFQRQVAQMGLSDMVRPRMMSSLKAASKRQRSIHLLFIDGGHKYPDVSLDYQIWSPFIPHGGRIAFHDYDKKYKGVMKVIDEIVIPSGLWTNPHTYGRIWSATRV